LLHDIKAILFDLGGILINLSVENFSSTWAELGVSRTRLQEFMSSKIIADWNKGFILEAEFCNALCVHLLDMRYETKLLKRAWNSLLADPNIAMLQYLVNANRAGYQCCVLSNTDPWHLELIKSKLAELKEIDRFAVSFELGFLKPDQRIFSAAAKSLCLTPAQTFFIDDSEENVSSALKCGFKGQALPAGSPPSLEMLNLLDLNKTKSGTL
jgi:HAD superfamily hydrolase (TIGR01509 family)